MSVLAVMASRNEAGYIEHALRRVIDDGMEVVLLDNHSVDGTREIAEGFLGNGLLRIEDQPFTGAFDLAEQLRRKAAIVAGASHDWIVNAAPDEWLHATSDATLPEFLEREVDPCTQVVDFVEYVFLPPAGVDMFGEDVRHLATSYYCFAPAPLRLMRAWRRGLPVDLVQSAGHRFREIDPAIVHPEPQVLRHYIGLSWSYAIAKRADRVYPETSLARGWHGNRRDYRLARPVLEHPALRWAEPWWVRELDGSAATRHHFWQDGFWATSDTGSHDPAQRGSARS
jgi:glycosyltransferase involved in cell wall biosynthesis